MQTIGVIKFSEFSETFFFLSWYETCNSNHITSVHTQIDNLVMFLNKFALQAKRYQTRGGKIPASVQNSLKISQYQVFDYVLQKKNSMRKRNSVHMKKNAWGSISYFARQIIMRQVKPICDIFDHLRVEKVPELYWLHPLTKAFGRMVG